MWDSECCCTKWLRRVVPSEADCGEGEALRLVERGRWKVEGGLKNCNASVYFHLKPPAFHPGQSAIKQQLQIGFFDISDLHLSFEQADL